MSDASTSAPAEEDARRHKEEWLAERKQEWTQAYVRRLQQQHEQGGSNGLLNQNQLEALAKQEWLRRQRIEHEQAVTRRKGQALQELATEQFTPLVDAALLSTPSTEKERWLQQRKQEWEVATHRRRSLQHDDSKPQWDQFLEVSPTCQAGGCSGSLAATGSAEGSGGGGSGGTGVYCKRGGRTGCRGGHGAGSQPCEERELCCTSPCASPLRATNDGAERRWRHRAKGDKDGFFDLLEA